MRLSVPEPENPHLIQDSAVIEDEVAKCLSSLTEISSGKVYFFSWSRDGKEIYYTLDPEYYLKGSEQVLWHKFDIYKNETLPLEDYSFWEIPAHADFIYNFINSLPQSEALIKVHSSPSGKRAIISIKVEQPGSSSGPDIIPEGTGPESLDIHDLYLLDVEGSQIYLGQVAGDISPSVKTSLGQSQPLFEGVVWSNSEDHAIVQMSSWSLEPWVIPSSDTVGEAFLWILNIDNATLEVLYAANRVAPNLYGFSPSGQYILYYSAGHFFYFDINESVEHPTRIEASPYVAWATDDLLIVFFLNAKRSEGDSVYLYNIHTGDFEILVELGLPVQHSVLGAIQLSPNKTKIAFRTENNYELYYFNVCY